MSNRAWPMHPTRRRGRPISGGCGGVSGRRFRFRGYAIANREYQGIQAGGSLRGVSLARMQPKQSPEIYHSRDAAS